MRLVVTATNGAGSATAVLGRDGAPERRAAQPGAADDPRQRRGRRAADRAIRAGGSPTTARSSSTTAGSAARPPTRTTASLIDGASGDVYTVTAADQGSRIRVDVTGTDAGGSATARSNPTLAVPSAYPVNTLAPYIVGDPVILTKLVANAGVWMSNYGPIELEYYWDRCDADGNALRVPAHRPQPHRGAKDIGHVLRVMVFASNDKGTSMAVARTAVIRYGAAGERRRSRAIAGDPVRGGAADRERRLVVEPVRRQDHDQLLLEPLRRGRERLRLPAHGPQPHARADDLGHVLRVMLSVETDHGVAITHVQIGARALGAAGQRRSAPCDRRRRGAVGAVDRASPGALDEPVRRQDHGQLLLEPLRRGRERLRVPAHRPQPHARAGRPRPRPAA